MGYMPDVLCGVTYVQIKSNRNSRELRTHMIGNLVGSQIGPPPTGVKIPEFGKRVSGSKRKLPFPITPEKGSLSQKIPYFATGQHKSFDPETLCPRLWGF